MIVKYITIANMIYLPYVINSCIYVTYENNFRHINKVEAVKNTLQIAYPRSNANLFSLLQTRRKTRSLSRIL